MELMDVAAVRRVAIVGTGTIGASWAAYFLARGLEVRAWDPAAGAEQRTRAAVTAAWPALRALGMAEGVEPAALSWCASLAECLAGAQFVQESAPERQALKLELYASFDGLLEPDAVMSTSTSGLLLSALQAGRRGAERYVLGHPFNPPHLIPLVEVLGGRATAPEVVDWTLAFYALHGKKPIRLNKEVPGHLANRLQAALWREAVDAVASGLASVEDVDTAIAHGPGLRWALMGPHTIFSLAGAPGGMAQFLDHFGPPMESWWADLRASPLDERVRTALVEGATAAAHGRSVAELAAERDALLIELLKLKRDRAGT